MPAQIICAGKELAIQWRPVHVLIGIDVDPFVRSSLSIKFWKCTSMSNTPDGDAQKN